MISPIFQDPGLMKLKELKEKQKSLKKLRRGSLGALSSGQGSLSFEGWGKDLEILEVKNWGRGSIASKEWVEGILGSKDPMTYGKCHGL